MAKRVLMIEDFPVIQKFYKSALEQAGYQLDIAASGDEALRIVAENEYDIILLDLLLPTINGIEFLEQFSNRPANTKIFVLSDFTDESRIQRARELGVSDYLVKSDNPPSELVKKLDAIGE